MKPKRKEPIENLAEDEVKGLDRPKILRNKALAALEKAKALEASRIARGAIWKQNSQFKTKRLTFQ